MTPPPSSLPRIGLLVAFLSELVIAASADAVPPVRIVATPNSGEVPDASCLDNRTIDLAYVRGEDLFHARSMDGGLSFSDECRINNSPGTVHPPNRFRGPDIAVDGSGTIHVAWYVNAYQRQRPQEEWGVHYARRTRDSEQFENARNLNHRPSDGYSLAVSHDGRIVAVFWLAEGLFLTPSSDGGDTFRDPIPMAGADPCECCATRAIITPTGAAICLYRDKRENHRDMHLLAIPLPSGAGSPSIMRLADDPWVIEACPMTGCHLGRVGSHVEVGWIRDGRLRWQLLASEAVPTVSTAIAGAAPPPSRIDSPQSNYPVVLFEPLSGVTCVSWKDAESLNWQLFDSAGNAIERASQKPTRSPHRHAGVVVDGAFLLFD